MVSGSADCTCKLWDPSTCQLVHTFQGHTHAVNAVLIRNQHLYSASEDCTLRLWSIRKGTALRTFPGNSPFKSLAVAGSVLMGGTSDKMIYVFLLKGSKPYMHQVARSAVSSVILVGKHIFCSSLDGVVRHWIEQPRVQEKDFDDKASVGSASASGSGGGGMITSRTAGPADKRPEPPSADSTALSFSATVLKKYSVGSRALCLRVAEQTLYCGSASGQILVTDTAARGCQIGPSQKLLLGHTDSVLALDTTADHLLSASADATVRVWDRKRNECTQTLTGHRGPVTALSCAWHVVYTGGLDMSIRKWLIESGALAIHGHAKEGDAAAA